MSRTVRELHLIRYGATTSQLKRGLTDGPEPPPSKEAVNAMVERLLHSVPHHHLVDEDGNVKANVGGYRSRQHCDSPATVNVGTLFPSYLSDVGGATSSTGAPRSGSVHLNSSGYGRSNSRRQSGMPAGASRGGNSKASRPPSDMSADTSCASIINKPIVDGDEVPAYPVDWRRNPSAFSTDPSAMRLDKGEATRQLRWLYLCFTLPLLPSFEAVTAETLRVVDQLMSRHGVPMVKSDTRRKDIRDMLRDPRRYGLLIDMISTRRTVMAGTPHAAASAIYRHCEERYPIYIKFAFIGITDNGTKRVARDIFSGGRVPVYEPASDEGADAGRGGGSSRRGGGKARSSTAQRQSSTSADVSQRKPSLGAGSSASSSSRVGNDNRASLKSATALSRLSSAYHPMGSLVTVSNIPDGGKPLPFSSIDSVHCFVAHPKGDEADILRLKGEEEKARKEAERIARRYTPKYAAPPPPEWMQRLLDAQERARTPTRREMAQRYYNNVSKPTAANTAHLQEQYEKLARAHNSGEGGASPPHGGNEEEGGGGAMVVDSASLAAMDREGITLIESSGGNWLYGKALGGESGEEWAKGEHTNSSTANNLPSPPRTDSTVGGFLPHLDSPFTGGLSSASPPAPSQEPATSNPLSPPPQTREQHYLSMAQRISERLRGGDGGGGGGPPSSRPSVKPQHTLNGYAGSGSSARARASAEA